jgi:hypothetical protein
MPLSAVPNFTEPDEYAAAIRARTVGLTVTERGYFTAKLVRIDSRLRSDAAEKRAESRPGAICNSKAPAAARSGWATGGGRPRNHRQPRGSAWTGAVAY